MEFCKCKQRWTPTGLPCHECRKVILKAQRRGTYMGYLNGKKEVKLCNNPKHPCYAFVDDIREAPHCPRCEAETPKLTAEEEQEFMLDKIQLAMDFS